MNNMKLIEFILLAIIALIIVLIVKDYIKIANNPRPCDFYKEISMESIPGRCLKYYLNENK